MTLVEARIGAQVPTVERTPEGPVDFSDGDDCVAWCERIGLDLLPWQRRIVRWLLATRADGSLAVTTATIVVGRQNGKGSILEAIELYEAATIDRCEQVHSAHLGKTSVGHQRRLAALAEGEPSLKVQTFAGNNDPRTKVGKDSVISFVTRSKSTSRGASPRRIVFDEAWALTDAQQGAMLPSLAAQTMRPETAAQVIHASSAPLPDSAVLRRRIANGRSANVGQREYYAEWFTERDREDVDGWYEANPSLGLLISEEWVATELRDLAAEDFDRERLGRFVEADGVASNLPGWGLCADRRSEPFGAAAVALAVAPDGSWASIGVAARRVDGAMHVEVAGRSEGTGWVVAALSAMTSHGPVAIEPRSMAGGLVADLLAAGVQVVEVPPLDALKACASFRLAVAERRVRHREQGPLESAVSAAAVAPAGDGWRWAPRSSSADISALQAVTLAHHRATTAKPRPARWGMV